MTDAGRLLMQVWLLHAAMCRSGRKLWDVSVAHRAHRREPPDARSRPGVVSKARRHGAVQAASVFTAELLHGPDTGAFLHPIVGVADPLTP